MILKNANQKPQRYFGLHMAEGVAEYREPGKTPYRVFIGETAIKNMDPSFEGCPVYVRHKDEIDPSQIGKANPEDPNLEPEEVGYIVRSFYNSADGKHWAEFLIISDRGHNAIRNGWKLSNAYKPGPDLANGGEWHGIGYAKEIRSGTYEHMALVPNPRYAESIILNPEEFKTYCEEKTIEIKRLANAKEKEPTMSLNFFKKQKVENSGDLESTSVKLPKSGKEIMISDLVKNADEMAMTEGKPMMANGDHMVKVGEDQMTVNALLEKHAAVCNEIAEMKKSNVAPAAGDDEEAKKKALELAAHEEKEMAAKKANSEKDAADKAAAEKKSNEEKEAADKAASEKKENDLKHFDLLKNANMNPIKEAPTVDFDKVARGQQRYGSNK